MSDPEEGLIMAPPNPHNHPKGRGIWKHKAGSSASNPADVKVADFSYQNDELAALIVKAWTPGSFHDSLVDPSLSWVQRTANAQTALQGLPIHPISLAYPIVITEDEYDAGWESDNDDQVVFVLPNATRVSGTTNLLETTKLLMACVPNGI
jgi:hypothetical protein